MMTNTNMTVYNLIRVGKDEVYQKTLVDAVFWSSQEGRIRRNENNISGDKVKVFLKKTTRADRVYLEPVDFASQDDKANFYTINDKTILVKGNGPVIKSVRDIPVHFKVTTVDDNDFGAEDMRHLVVIAK